MTKPVYELAVIGAGAAGLQLVYEYMQNPAHREFSVLLIDSGDRSEKSWCFWEEKDAIFPFLVEKKWKNLSFTDQNNQKIQFNDLTHAYNYISSDRFFDYFFIEFLPKYPNIHVVKDLVRAVDDGQMQITLASGESYQAKRIADSRIEKKVQSEADHLYQHFFGKFVEFDLPVLDAETATMMDFSHGQWSDDFTCFHYLLPFSATQGLIETTVFSKKAYDLSAYQTIWGSYMQTKFGEASYTVSKEERGTIPMYQNPVSFGTKSVIKIGTAAGMVKASTGYAFSRMNRDAKNILSNRNRASAIRFRFYDRILLHIIRHEIDQIPAVMSRLFRSASITQILLFLDEKSSIWQEIRMFAKLDIGLFLKHLYRSYSWKK